MVSKTKFFLEDKTIEQLFAAAGIEGVRSVAPLGAGEFNAVYEVVADKAYVLKVAPGPGAPILRYERGMMRAEVEWYAVMRAQTDIRVPAVYYSDFTRTLIPTDWFLMEKMAGTPLNKADITKEEKAAARIITAEAVTQLHRIHNDKFGYSQDEMFDNWYLALQSIIENLITDCKQKGRATRRGARFLQYVDQYKEVFAAAECCLVNFDINDMNIMCTRENGALQYAWIDPERSFWGDRIIDFVCLEILKPFPKKTASLRAYNAKAEQPVTTDRNARIRYAAGSALMALLMEVEKYYRYTPHHFGWWRNVAAAAVLYRQAFNLFKGDEA